MTERGSKQVTSVARRKPPAAGKGRKKGSLNKTTASVKQALIDAFEKMGGVPSLVTWGKEHPTEFYKLYVKLLPTDVQLSGKDGEPLKVIFTHE
ncbi:hypothetical protein [Humibacter sp.]|uniref:hypothetical protein n=1 Tax=Humibacter sp. TaxID=1940291 RepID=UPI003F7D6388